MDFSEKLSNKIFEFVILVQSLGKKNEYLYKINNTSFYIRKNTSDIFNISEIWNNKVYNIKIKKEDNIIDLGANIGAFTIFAANKTTDGKVFAFEPEYSNYQQLVKNINLNKLKNTFAYKLGIADKKCNRPLFLSDISKTSSSIYESHTGNIEKIDCIPLKSVLKLCDIKKIDLLKMDVEGAEYDILFSAPKNILRRISCIILEFHNFLNLKYNHKDLVIFLKKNDFEVSVCSPRKFIPQKLYTSLSKKGILKAIK